MDVDMEGRNGIGHHPFARSAAPLSHAFWILAGGIARPESLDVPAERVKGSRWDGCVRLVTT